MRAEIAATPDLAGFSPQSAPERATTRAGGEVETALIGAHAVAPSQGDCVRRGPRRPLRARLWPAGDAAIYRDRADSRRSPRQAGGARRRQPLLDRRRRRRHASGEPGQRAAIERRAAARDRRDASGKRFRVQRVRFLQRPVAARLDGLAPARRRTRWPSIWKPRRCKRCASTSGSGAPTRCWCSTSA